MPDAPDTNSPDAQSAALSSLKANIRGLFENLIVVCGHKGQTRKPLHEAAHKLLNQAIEDSRSATLNFIIEHIRVWADRVTACVSILRPELSRFELDVMTIYIQGAMHFSHRYFDVIQKMRGAVLTDGDLERMAQIFIDFSIRGLGIPDVFTNEGA